MTTTIQELSAELVVSGIPKVDLPEDEEGLLCRAFELRDQGQDYWRVRDAEIMIHSHGPDGFWVAVGADDDGVITYTEIEHVDPAEVPEADFPDPTPWVLKVPGWPGIERTRELAAELLKLRIRSEGQA